MGAIANPAAQAAEFSLSILIIDPVITFRGQQRAVHGFRRIPLKIEVRLPQVKLLF